MNPKVPVPFLGGDGGNAVSLPDISNGDGLPLLHGCAFCGMLSANRPHPNERVQLPGDAMGLPVEPRRLYGLHIASGQQRTRFHG